MATPPTPNPRPITDQEFANLSDDQLTALGLKPAVQGAPSDFSGPVYPNPDGVKPVSDQDAGSEGPTRLPNGVSLSNPLFKGAAHMDTTNPAAAQLLPSGSTTIAAKTAGAPIDANASPSMLSSILDAAKREGSSTLDSISGIPSGIYHSFADAPNTAQEKNLMAGHSSTLGRVALGADRMLAEPISTAATWYKQAAQGKVPDAYGQALSVAPEAIGTGVAAPLTEKLAAPLAAEHPAVANQALAEHSLYGGSTTNPRTGASLNGTKNWSVGVAPEATQISEKGFTPQEYNDFATQHKDLLAQHQNSAIGTSYDPTTGLHHMEITATTPSKTAAMNMAYHLGEDNIFHLGTNEAVPTGATGDRPLTHLSIDDRLEQLRGDSPTKQPFSGTHFSDAKLDTIDGARRGTSGVGAESARLRLGSQTGMGPDAPPGFHAYQSGSLPEAQIAGKKNAYNVRGQMAFASTDHPLFQAGYQEGVQNALAKGADAQTAHQLGLNNAEHALQSAGFDGYHTPSNPGARFVFGSHDVTPVGKYAAPTSAGGPEMDLPETTSGGSRKLNLGHPDVTPEAVGKSVKLPADRFSAVPEENKSLTIDGRPFVLGANTELPKDLGANARAASESIFGALPRTGAKAAGK